MADGVKLASGYVEVTAKTDAARKAVQQIFDDADKAADKAGKQAGDALNKGISRGAKDAGQSVGKEISTAAAKAGTDAGDAIGKGVEKGAQAAGKKVGDELTTAMKKAADDIGKTKIEPKVTPKVDTKPAKDDVRGIGDSIRDSLREAAERSGHSLDDVWAEAGKRAGGILAGVLKDSPLGGMFDGVAEKVTPIIGNFRDMESSLNRIKNGNSLGPLGEQLQSITGALSGFDSKASGLEGTLGRIGGKAGQIGQLAGGLSTVINLLNDPKLNEQASKIPGMGVLDNIIHKYPQEAGDWLHDHLGLPDISHGSGAQAVYGPPADQKPAQPVPPPSADGLKKLLLPPGLAGGGVITGPGTGTSDSILGVGADGVPTALVSNGEGVVKKSAMDRGGAAIVAALNGGLPGYDDGTTNVGGPPIPMPEVKVPEASGGQAGAFNQWLNAQQGKAYQYGTLYDCSGFMSQVYNQITGKNMPRFNTESDLAAYGFVRGTAPGTFQLGIHHGGGGMNSHMAGTLPDGRNVESAGNGVQIGAGAHGAFDKQFEDHWYLPGSGGMGGASGASGADGMPLGPLAFGGGAGGGAVPPGVPTDPASGAAAGGPAGIAQRTQGYIPAGAGASGQAGSSLFSGALQLGANAINGLIDQAASAAATAVSAAATAGSFGAGGQAAGPAAAFAIGLGTQAAKRGVSYGFQMAGIGADALAEILSPFGVPRFFQTDPTQFMPHIGTQPTGVTTGEKAQLQGAQQQSGQQPNPALNPGGPVQPGQLPGAQPVASPVQMAQPQGVTSAPVPIGAPPGVTPGAPAGPAVPKPVSPIAPPQPQSGPMAGQQQQPQQPKNITDMLTQLTGMSGGGIVGVYDSGGWLPAGGIAINQSKRPEPILNDQQWAALNAAVAAPASPPDPSANGGSGPDFSVHLGDVHVKDVDELMNQIDSRKRLQMMRYAGRP